MLHLVVERSCYLRVRIMLMTSDPETLALDPRSFRKQCSAFMLESLGPTARL